MRAEPSKRFTKRLCNEFSMATIYNTQEQEIMTKGGEKLSWILTELSEHLRPGMSHHDIEMKCRALIEMVGAKSGTIGYQTRKSDPPFPAATCISVNSHVAHGIGYQNETVIQEGDLVSLDVIIVWKGMFVDICRSYLVGESVPERKKLLQCSRACTNAAIKAAIVGNTTDHIGRAAEKVAKSYGFDTVKELGGHGVGREIHMEPFVPSFGGSGYATKLEEGMILAIEPIVTAGGWEIKMLSDGWTFQTKDGSDTSQFEETVLITKDGPKILTRDR